MIFQNPLWLLASLAVLIPIMIHLWSQKPGKKIEWAAMQFLPEKDHLRNKGWRLNDLLLLLVRCSLLVLLSLILAGLFLKSAPFSSDQKTVHLFEKYPGLEDNFAFELEQAKAAGERMYWIENGELIAMEETWMPEEIPEGRPWMLGVKEIKADKINLYISAYTDLLPNHPISIPSDLMVHVYDPVKPILKTKNYLRSASGKFLFLNEAGMLTLAETAPTSFDQELPSKIQHYAHDFTTEAEIKTLQSVLNAVQEVFDISFQEGDKPEVRLFFTSEIPEKIQEDTFYFVFNQMGEASSPRVLYLGEGLDKRSTLVKDGRLPEVILNPILQLLGLERHPAKTSENQISTYFVADQSPAREARFPMKHVLFALLLILFGIERTMAIPKQL